MANPLTAPKHFIIIIKGSEWAPGIGKFLPQRFNSIFLEAPDEKGPTSATKVFLVLNPRGEIGSPVAARGVSHSLQAAAHGSRLPGPQSRCPLSTRWEGLLLGAPKLPAELSASLKLRELSGLLDLLQKILGT